MRKLRITYINKYGERAEITTMISKQLAIKINKCESIIDMRLL